MSNLLVVHHTVSPLLQNCLESALSGANAVVEQLKDEAKLNVVVRPALAANASDVLDCNAVLLGTPANIGYMSGALKHFFDQIYYPTLSACAGLPYGVYVHGNDDCAGAVRSIERVAGGLGWKLVGQPAIATGEFTSADSIRLATLGENLAAAALGILPA